MKFDVFKLTFLMESILDSCQFSKDIKNERKSYSIIDF